MTFIADNRSGTVDRDRIIAFIADFHPNIESSLDLLFGNLQTRVC